MGRRLPEEEIEAIFKRFPKNNIYYLPLLLAYECGLSKGEIFGLTSQSIRTGSVYLSIHHIARFDRKTNRTFFMQVPEAEVRKVYAPREVRRLLHRNLDIIPFTNCFDERLLMIRPDGSYITPQGINYVARVIHGKTSHIDYVDPDWRLEDMITSKIA